MSEKIMKFTRREMEIIRDALICLLAPPSSFPMRLKNAKEGLAQMLSDQTEVCEKCGGFGIFLDTSSYPVCRRCSGTGFKS